MNLQINVKAIWVRTVSAVLHACTKQTIGGKNKKFKKPEKQQQQQISNKQMNKQQQNKNINIFSK